MLPIPLIWITSRDCRNFMFFFTRNLIIDFTYLTLLKHWPKKKNFLCTSVWIEIWAHAIPKKEKIRKTTEWLSSGNSFYFFLKKSIIIFKAFNFALLNFLFLLLKFLVGDIRITAPCELAGSPTTHHITYPPHLVTYQSAFCNANSCYPSPRTCVSHTEEVATRVGFRERRMQSLGKFRTIYEIPYKFYRFYCSFCRVESQSFIVCLS